MNPGKATALLGVLAAFSIALTLYFAFPNFSPPLLFASGISGQLSPAQSPVPASDLNEKALPAEVILAASEAVALNDQNRCDSIGGQWEAYCIKAVEVSGANCEADRAFEKFFCVAFLENDANYCEFIEVQWYRAACLAILSQDISRCNEAVNDFGKAMCIRDFAVSFSDFDCKDLNEPGWTEFCSIARQRAVENCNSITDGGIKSACLEVLSLETGQESEPV
ncbi:MAG: hypothetical protein NT067_05080 [Candidatus Diapherotrites archaeon]|nr:hypothetical protein [Candidatus Diapherotrites archaeon]